MILNEETRVSETGNRSEGFKRGKKVARHVLSYLMSFHIPYISCAITSNLILLNPILLKLASPSLICILPISAISDGDSPKGAVETVNNLIRILTKHVKFAVS